MLHDMYMDDDLPLHQEQHDDGATYFDSNDNLENLFRSHLDALLANSAETLSHKAENVMSCPLVKLLVAKKSTMRHNPLLHSLQLVNNEDVKLDRGGTDSESMCYTDANPFYIKLLNRDKRREEVQLRSIKKRAKSSTEKECTKGIGTIKSFFDANLALTEQPPKFEFYDPKTPFYTSLRNVAPNTP